MIFKYHCILKKRIIWYEIWSMINLNHADTLWCQSLPTAFLVVARKELLYNGNGWLEPSAALEPHSPRIPTWRRGIIPLCFV